jgi:hypothetical protein
MLPLGLVNLVAVAIVYELRQVNDPAGLSFGWSAAMYVVPWIVFGLAWLAVAVANPLVTDNRPRHDLSTGGVDSQI